MPYKVQHEYRDHGKHMNKTNIHPQLNLTLVSGAHIRLGGRKTEMRYWRNKLYFHSMFETEQMSFEPY